MRDEIVRAITADGLVKAVAITGRDLVERARNIHTLLPVATAALGRTLHGRLHDGGYAERATAPPSPSRSRAAAPWAPFWPCPTDGGQRAGLCAESPRGAHGEGPR